MACKLAESCRQSTLSPRLLGQCETAACGAHLYLTGCLGISLVAGSSWRGGAPHTRRGCGPPLCSTLMMSLSSFGLDAIGYARELLRAGGIIFVLPRELQKTRVAPVSPICNLQLFAYLTTIRCNWRRASVHFLPSAIAAGEGRCVM
ncbi:hypothetical protein BOTBODRAFT_459618 [Botryobasidium botryosum FD-172 SS1]|uniref:Uncharacterized protein n=1 Tax=Botryobasidium botryosum (strain FD-172 SS1) TaxID=930990 RepID=A0A067M9M7_BOTB1|nr:hypothetical protein BOTBODRAFT_459618 [Botryobasidium botryosum FD-172 SS1]